MISASYGTVTSLVSPTASITPRRTTIVPGSSTLPGAATTLAPLMAYAAGYSPAPSVDPSSRAAVDHAAGTARPTTHSIPDSRASPRQPKLDRSDGLMDVLPQVFFFVEAGFVVPRERAVR